MEEKKDRKERSIAVALDYDPLKNKAPKVVATGRGHLAEQIMEIAFANGVKVRQDADLAEILTAVDVQSEIPLEAFTAVAEILSYVYQINNSYPDGLNPTVIEIPEEGIPDNFQSTDEQETDKEDE